MDVLSVLVLLLKSALASGGVCWDCGKSFLFLSRAEGHLGFLAGTGQAAVVSGGDVCTLPAPGASTAALPQHLQGCHLSPLPMAQVGFLGEAVSVCSEYEQRLPSAGRSN